MLASNVMAVVATAGGLFGAWLFIGAAAQKMSDFPRFSATLAAYRVFPESVTYPMALLVVGAELLAGAAMLLMFGLPLVWSATALQASLWNLLLFAAAVGPVLLFVYAGAMALNLLRDRASIDCGCGGAPMPLSKALVARNLSLSGVLLWIVLDNPAAHLPEPAPEPIGIGLPVLVLGCCLVFCCIYLIANQLLANRALHDRLWVRA